MRPHQLRVTAFGAFGGTVTVNFDDLASSGLFLLHGETGAGKTTLLDAIGFALYGRVPGERGKTRRLRSDHAAPGTATEVCLETTLGGRRMRITRRPEQERAKLRGAGITTSPAKILLEELTDGAWHAVSTRAGEADAEIADLMGMSAEQFFQVVLLPQGQFAQFLHANAELRGELLQRLFGTDRFRQVESWLAERRRATARAVEEAESRIETLAALVAQAAGSEVPGDGPGLAGWGEQLAAAAAADAAASAIQAEACRRDLDQALHRERETTSLAGRQRRRQAALDARGQLARAEAGLQQQRAELAAAVRAAEVAAALAESERTAAALAQARDAEQEARSGAGPAAGASAAGLRAAAQEHLARLGALEALRAVAQQADDEDQAAVTARAAVTDLTAQIDAARRDAEAQRGRRPELSRERDQAAEAGQQLPAAQAGADRHRRAADDAKALVEAQADRSRQERAYVDAKLEAAELIGEATRLRERRIDGMRAELAATLVDGAPCPVCGSIDHPELCELPGDQVTREQEAAADAEAAIAAEQAELTGAKLGAADERVAQLSARLEQAGFMAAVDAAEANRLDTAARDLADQVATLARTAGQSAGVQVRLDALDTALAETARRVVELTGQRDAELRQAAAAEDRAAGHRSSLLAQLDGYPGLDPALAAVRAAAETLTAAADAADAATRAAGEASRTASLAARAAAAAGFGTLDGVRQALRDHAWRAAAEQDILEHEASARAVAGRLADPDLDVPLDPPADVTGAQADVEAASKTYEDARDAERLAQHQAGQLATLVPELVTGLTDLEPLAAAAAEARRLADLAAGQGANALKMTLSSFVLAARLEEVAAAASQRLLRMTSGRYSLVHTDARRGGGRSGLGLLACDGWTGVDRDTSTLSGGETFLASLALALGLADVVTAEAGGARIEALFVDEGFGSLDEDTLEEVMTVLDSLREGGRLVGIVSHVAELRQRVPAQIRVRKGRSGSDLTVRSQVT